MKTLRFAVVAAVLLAVLVPAGNLAASGRKDTGSEGGRGTSVPTGQPPAGTSTPAPMPQAPPPAPAPQAPPEPVSPYFTGNGGRGTRIAVLVPDGVGLPEEQNYLPALVQGVLVGDLTRFSAFSVLDRLGLEKVLTETESGIYRSEEDFGQLGEIANVDFVVTGTITRTSGGHSLDIRVTGTGRDTAGVSRASFQGTPTVAEMDNFTGIRRASMDLLTQMGVSLTDNARQELAGAATRQTVGAQTALAQGIVAQQSGTVVEALSRYIQANNRDPSLAEAAARVNVLAANISSGNIREDVRNEIRWRDEWLATLRETDEFYQRYVSRPPPLTLTYTTNVSQGNIDFNARTVELSGVEVNLFLDLEWLATIDRVLLTVQDGLRATERAERWGIDWPILPRIDSDPPLPLPPYVHNERAIWPTVEILNSQGTVLGSRTVGIPYGWNIVNGFVVDRDRYVTSQFHSIRIIPVRAYAVSLAFPGVNPDHITDDLTVRISAINGIPTERASEQRNISVMTRDEFLLTPEYRGRAAILENLKTPGASMVYPPALSLNTTGLNRGGMRGPLDVNITQWHPPERNNEVYYDICNFGVRDVGFISTGGRALIFPSSVTSVSPHPDGDNIAMPSSVRNLTIQGGHTAQVVIGANVNVQGTQLWGGFQAFYNGNGRRAGIYVLQTIPDRQVNSGLRYQWAYIPHQIEPW